MRKSPEKTQHVLRISVRNMIGIGKNFCRCPNSSNTFLFERIELHKQQNKAYTCLSMLKREGSGGVWLQKEHIRLESDLYKN